jgi:uncharacterized protein
VVRRDGLPWIDPSPNIRSLDAALHYAGVVLFEATNVTVGRGTDAPMSYIGAPWLDTPPAGADGQYDLPGRSGSAGRRRTGRGSGCGSATGSTADPVPHPARTVPMTDEPLPYPPGAPPGDPTGAPASADAGPADPDPVLPEHAHAVPAAEAPPAHVPDGAPRSLDPRALRLWRISAAVSTVIWTTLAAVGSFTPVERVPWLAIAAAIAVLGALYTAFWTRAEFRAWSFRMRERDLVVRYGVLWRTVSVIPFSRIQHVDTRHGPIERGFGLSSLIIYTAGVRGADVTVPGLATADAEALREHLARIGGSEDAV